MQQNNNISSTFTEYCTGYCGFGFNGKENDNEVKGVGNQQDYGFRIYDPRIGKFLSVDPLTKSYPWYTPYQFAGNNPIKFIDLDGLEPAQKKVPSYKPVISPTSFSEVVEKAKEHCDLVNLEVKKLYPNLKNPYLQDVATFQIKKLTEVSNGKLVMKEQEKQKNEKNEIVEQIFDKILDKVEENLEDKATDYIEKNVKSKVVQVGLKVLKITSNKTLGYALEHSDVGLGSTTQVKEESFFKKGVVDNLKRDLIPVKIEKFDINKKMEESNKRANPIDNVRTNK